MTRRPSALPGRLGQQILGAPLLSATEQDRIAADMKALATLLGQNEPGELPPKPITQPTHAPD
jgi:hypothetical protein